MKRYIMQINLFIYFKDSSLDDLSFSVSGDNFTSAGKFIHY